MTDVVKVALCTPYYRAVEGNMYLSAMGLALRTATHRERPIAMMPISCSGAYVEQNRNGCIKYALETGIPFDYVQWIDTDMTFPDTSLIRLIGHDKDIVGPNYRTRTAPFRHAAHYLDGTDLHLMEPGLHQMAHIPTGLMLCKFDIFRQLAPPWFVSPTTENEPRDDVYFCNLARAHGYEIWCDHDLTCEVRHRTIQDLTWFEPGQVIVRGAELNWTEEDAATAKRAAMSREQWNASERGQARSVVDDPLAQRGVA